MVFKRIILFGFCFSAVAFCGACGGDDGAENETGHSCADTDQVNMPELGDADRIASIKFDELTEVDSDGNEETYSDVSAHFDDFSNFDEGLTPVTPFGAACVGILGRPVSTGELVSLHVDSVTVSGETMGEMLFEQDTDGNVIPMSLDKMFSSKGGETLQIDVTSGTGEEAFPPFSETIEVPAPIEDIRFEMQGDGSFEIDWTGADSTYFEITLRTLQTGGSGQDNRLRCYFLADDDCFIVPSDAMDWLRSAGDIEFSLLVERHRLKISSVEENALLQIDALRSIKRNIVI